MNYKHKYLAPIVPNIGVVITCEDLKGSLCSLDIEQVGQTLVESDLSYLIEKDCRSLFNSS